MRSSTKGPYNWNQMALQCMYAFTLLLVLELYRHGLPKKPDNIRTTPKRSRPVGHAPHGCLQHRFYPQTRVRTSAFTHINDQNPWSLHTSTDPQQSHQEKSCVFQTENLVGKPLINQSYLDKTLNNVVTCQSGVVSLSKYNIHDKVRLGWCDELYQKTLWALLSAVIRNPHSTLCLVLKLWVFGERL